MGEGVFRQAGRLRILRGFRFKQFTRLQPQGKNATAKGDSQLRGIERIDCEGE